MLVVIDGSLVDPIRFLGVVSFLYRSAPTLRVPIIYVGGPEEPLMLVRWEGRVTVSTRSAHGGRDGCLRAISSEIASTRRLDQVQLACAGG